MLPGQQAFDFIGYKSAQAEKDPAKLAQSELKQLLQHRAKFDESSTDAKAFEAELKILSAHALLN